MGPIYGNQGYYICIPETNGEPAGITFTVPLAVYAYKELFKIELQKPGTDVMIPAFNTAGKSLRSLLFLQDDDGGVFHSSAGAGLDFISAKNAAATAVFAGVTAYACVCKQREPDGRLGALLPDRNILFSSAVAAGSYLKEVMPENPAVGNESIIPYYPDYIGSHCYWAFAELFRLTGCSEWLKYCCGFEEDVIESSMCYGKDCEDTFFARPLDWTDMSSAAVWALYKTGDAEYYRRQLENIYGELL